jgi:hypothetical protein
MLDAEKDEAAGHAVGILAALSDPRHGVLLNVFHRLNARFPQRIPDAGIAALQGRGDALGHAGEKFPSRHPVLHQQRRQLLARMRVEAVQQPGELLKCRRAGQAQPGGILAAPLAAQLRAVEVIAAICLAEILGRLASVGDGHHSQHRPSLRRC